MQTLNDHSFPSGHSVAAMCFFFGTFYLLSLLPEYHEIRHKLRFSGLTIGLLIGFSRIYLGVHYPTDVLAGVVFALFWMASTALIVISVQKLFVKLDLSRIWKTNENI